MCLPLCLAPPPGPSAGGESREVRPHRGGRAVEGEGGAGRQDSPPGRLQVAREERLGIGQPGFVYLSRLGPGL